MSRRIRFASLLVAVLAAQACAYTSSLTPTQPTARTQQLLLRSLERAAQGLDLSGLRGRRVRLAFVGQGADAAFARDWFAMRLAREGVHVVDDGAEIELRVVAGVLGTDRGETLLGIPPSVIPVLAIPLPEMALLKVVQNRGLVELESYSFDASTGDGIASSGPVEGRARRDDYTVLFAIGFSRTDADLETAEPLR